MVWRPSRRSGAEDRRVSAVARVDVLPVLLFRAPSADTIDYLYDDCERPSGATYGNRATIAYAYGAVGNPLNRTVAGAPESFDYRFPQSPALALAGQPNRELRGGERPSVNAR